MAAPAIPCHDGMAAGVGLGTCSSFAFQPAGTAVPTSTHWHQTPCAMAAAGAAVHPTPHLVCSVCADNMTSLPAAQTLYSDIISKSPEGCPNGMPYKVGDPMTAPWPAALAPGVRRFGTFWTRLCKSCEREAQEVFWRKITEFRLGVGVQTPASLPNSWEPLFNLCECLKHLGWPGPGTNPVPLGHLAPPRQPPVNIATNTERQRWCSTCFNALMVAMPNNVQTNDDWLRTTGRSSDGKLCLASPATKRRRDSPKSSSYRACYCSGDADTGPNQAEVLLCMNCEKLRCVIEPNTPASRHQFGTQPPRPRRNRRPPASGATPRGTGSVTIGRDREDFQDNR